MNEHELHLEFARPTDGTVSLILLGWIASNFRVPYGAIERELSRALRRREIGEQFDLGGEG